MTSSKRALNIPRPGAAGAMSRRWPLIGLLVTALAGAAIFITPPAWTQSQPGVASGNPTLSKPQPPTQANLYDCQTWAADKSGYHVSSTSAVTDLGPVYNNPQYYYNRWLGLCLGQREPH